MHRSKLQKRRITILALISLSILAFCALPGVNAQQDFYQINANLPQSEVQNLEVSATLPVGLIYKNTISVTDKNGNSITLGDPTITPPNDGTSEVTVIWNFGDFDNNDNGDIIVKFRAVAANTVGNQAGLVLGSCEAALSYTLGAQGYTYEGLSEPVVIVEPVLNVTKESTDNGNNKFTYDIYVYHAPESEAKAYDLKVTETLEDGLNYVADSMKVISGPAYDMDYSDTKSLKWNFDQADLTWNSGNKIHLQYQAIVDTAISTSTELIWSSAEGDNDDERTYTKRLDHSLSSLKVSVIPDKAEARVDDTVTYTFEVENTGHARIEEIGLVALVQRTTNLGTITLDKTALDPGEKASSTQGPYTYIVTQADCGMEMVSCNAEATGQDKRFNMANKEITAVGSASVIILNDPLTVNKIALDKKVKRGDNVTYLIQIHNTEDPGLPAKDVVVEDIFNKDVEFIYAYPPPDEDGKWRFDSIEPGEWVNITLNVKIPEEPELVLEAIHSIAGEGFVRVRDHYSTNFKSYVLQNRVKVTFLNTTYGEGTVETIWDDETVNVISDLGPELDIKEHGSGSYKSDEVVHLDTKDRDIRQAKDVSASYDQITIGLYNNRTVTYKSRWSQETQAVNRATNTVFHGDYKYLNEIDRVSLIDMDRNGTIAEVEAEFDGMAYIGLTKMPTNATRQSTPIFESREDYTGSFKVVDYIDEYFLGTSSKRSVSGSGSVVVDKRIGESQRSHESGSGSYVSDEIITTPSKYIAKDINLVYAPTKQNLTDDFSIDSTMKWNEGVWSKTRKLHS